MVRFMIQLEHTVTRPRTATRPLRTVKLVKICPSSRFLRQACISTKDRLLTGWRLNREVVPDDALWNMSRRSCKITRSLMSVSKKMFVTFQALLSKNPPWKQTRGAWKYSAPKNKILHKSLNQMFAIIVLNYDLLLLPQHPTDFNSNLCRAFFWFRKRQWRHLSSKKYLFTTHHQLTWNIVFGRIEGNKRYVRWDSTFKTVSPFVLTLSNLPWKIFFKRNVVS